MYFTISQCIVQLNFKIKFSKNYLELLMETPAPFLGCCPEECLKLEIYELSKFL